MTVSRERQSPTAAAHKDPSGWRGLLQLGGNVDGRADGVESGCAAPIELPHSGKTRVNADAETDACAVGPEALIAHLSEVPGGGAGPVGVILKGRRPSEGRDPAISGVAYQHAVGALHGSANIVEQAVEEGLRFVRVAGGYVPRRSDDVGGQNGDDLALGRGLGGRQRRLRRSPRGRSWERIRLRYHGTPPAPLAGARNVPQAEQPNIPSFGERNST